MNIFVLLLLSAAAPAAAQAPMHRPMLELRLAYDLPADGRREVAFEGERLHPDPRPLRSHTDIQDVGASTRPGQLLRDLAGPSAPVIHTPGPNAPMETRDTLQGPEAEVWNAVLAGWEALRSGDVDRWMANFHPEFTGWSTARPQPYDVAAERSGTEAFLADWEWETYHVEPLSIRIVDDIAVIHYAYREVLRAKEGDGRHDETGRATQVMKRDGGRWLMLAIMSGPVPPS